MSSVPNITPSYSSDRPQIVGRIGQPKGTVSTPADIAAAILAADKTDTVEFSSEALAASTPAAAPVAADATRAERLAQIKAQIQAGTYGEDAKLTFAADRLARLFANG